MAAKKIKSDKVKQEELEKVTKPKKIGKPKEPEKVEIKKEHHESKEKKETAIETKAVNFSDPYQIIRFVLMTEKSIQNIEKENKLVFIVNREATKKQISDAVQSAFSAAASNVKTSIDQKGRKKAFVRFAKAGEAGDIAVRLGII